MPEIGGGGHVGLSEVPLLLPLPLGAHEAQIPLVVHDDVEEPPHRGVYFEACRWQTKGCGGQGSS